MIWRILCDRQVVVITESYGRLYRTWDARSLEDVCQMCCETFDKAKEMLDKSKGKQGRKVAEPIPLTPEILKKNGWKHKDDVYFKDYPQRKLVIIDDEAYIINESCSLFLCKVEFVHQLQHLLFGLGLNSEMEV